VWQGHVLKEVRALEKLPAGIRSNLGANRQGLEGVADRGRPFNVTDVVNDKLPMRRLLTAGQDGATWLVALEHGGRGYNVEVFLFSAPDSTPVQKWVLLNRPGNLREVVQELPQFAPARQRR